MLQVLGKRLKNQRGFTLIELLAVIVILGIIAAIAVPAIGNVISKSQDKAKVAEGLQIIDAAKLYTTNHTLTYDESGDATITAAQLNENLDHVKDSTFTVDVHKDSTTNKLTYLLEGHDSVTVSGVDTNNDSKASEQELTSFSN